MFKHPIAQIAMPIMYSCNLRCKYCTHYCDFGYKGEVDYEQGEQWLRSWAKRVSPEIFRLHGGEPLLHKYVKKYVQICAQYFPEAKRDLVTNGLLLCEHKDLLYVLMDTNTTLTISLHPLGSKNQEEMVNRALSLAMQYREKGLRLRITDSPRQWRRCYQDEGTAILPFTDGDPDRSFQNCIFTHCAQLHQGKLWKCAILAYLPMIADRLENKHAWKPYLRYQPLDVDASDEELAAFIKKDSQFCGMCPTEPRLVSIEGVVPRNPCLDILRSKLKKSQPGNAETNQTVRANLH